jgi:hypothetical protein
MDYVLKRHKDGTFQMFLALPGRGDIQSAAKGATRAEATVKAARQLYGKSAAAAEAAPPAQKAEAEKKRKKAAIALAVAKAASNPAIRSALKTGGLAAAELAASAIPGGAIALKAVRLARKFAPARKLFAALIK